MAIRTLTLQQAVYKQLAAPVEDFLKTLRTIADQVNELLGRQRTVERQLASVTLEVDLGVDNKGSPRMDKLKPESIKVSSLKELRSNYSVLRDLFDTLTVLESMEAKLQTGLSKSADINPAKAMAELTRLKTQVKTGIKSALAFLSQLSGQHHPKALEKFASMVMNALSANIQYEEIGMRSFVFEAEGALCFSDYIRLGGVTDEDGEYKPEVYVVLTYKTGQKPEVFVAALTSFQPPSEDLLAKRVASIKDTLSALSMLLALEKVSNTMATIPVSMVLKPESISKGLFSYEKYISKITADENQVTFTLKTTVKDRSMVDQVSAQVFKEFSKIIRKTNARLRMSVSKAAKAFLIQFFFVTTSDGPLVDLEDMRFLADRFNLDETSLAKIVQVINVGT